MCSAAGVLYFDPICDGGISYPICTTTSKKDQKITQKRYRTDKLSADDADVVLAWAKEVANQEDLPNQIQRPFTPQPSEQTLSATEHPRPSLTRGRCGDRRQSAAHLMNGA